MGIDTRDPGAVHRGRRRRGVAVAGLVMVAVIAAAVAFVLHRGGTTSALELHGCTVGDRTARCGRLAVPEDPSAPGAKKIELDVAVVPATGGHAEPDPLFWFAGWGGAGVSDDAANVVPALRLVNVDHDLVFIDQRGTGSSELRCPLIPADRALSARPGAVTAAARRCADRIGPGLRSYTSAVAVDDVDRVRQALGYDKIDVYGGSYGATTGQIYLLRHGTHVRTATFDSGSLLDVRVFERVAPNAQRALDLLLARCAADTACDTAFPRLRRDFATARARVAKAPIRIPGAAVPLNPTTMAGAVEELLASVEGKAILPRLIHLVATGRTARAARLATRAGGIETGELAYQLLIQCSEPWASRRPAAVRRLASGTFFAPAAELQTRRVEAACRGFPRAHVPAAIGRRVHSRVPVLFLTGDEDPADPPANVAHARRELPDSRTVVFPASGHGQLGLLCAQNLIADFVAAGTPARLNAACAKAAVRQPFDYAG